MNVIELFAGAGGAALGLESVGLHHTALCEWDASACATLRAAGLGPVVEGDVRDLNAIAAVAGDRCDVLWSSFPCQAFSSAGSRKGAHDERNGWPWTVDALDRFRPAWFLGENVRGLLCHRGDCDRRGDPMDCPGCYFHRVILADLRDRFAFSGWWLLDAADYGVPQHRRRVILWGGPVPLTPPVRTHGLGMFTRPWVTMGDALGLVAMPGLTDRPSRSVICSEVKGSGPGGSPEKHKRASDALYLATGRRRLTVQVCSTLQDFPSDHPWQGTKTAQYRQVGNAVPPALAAVVGRVLVRAAEAGRPPTRTVGHVRPFGHL